VFSATHPCLTILPNRNPLRYHLKIREEKIKEVEEKNWSLFAEEDAAAAAKKAKKKSRYA